MDKTAIASGIQQIFASVFSQPDIVITPDLTADRVPKWDSLSHLTMIAEVEKHFQVKFKLKELVGMKNVGELIDLIHSKKTA